MQVGLSRQSNGHTHFPGGAEPRRTPTPRLCTTRQSRRTIAATTNVSLVPATCCHSRSAMTKTASTRREPATLRRCVVYVHGNVEDRNGHSARRAVRQWAGGTGDYDVSSNDGRIVRIVLDRFRRVGRRRILESQHLECLSGDIRLPGALQPQHDRQPWAGRGLVGDREDRDMVGRVLGGDAVNVGGRPDIGRAAALMLTCFLAAACSAAVAPAASSTVVASEAPGNQGSLVPSAQSAVTPPPDLSALQLPPDLGDEESYSSRIVASFEASAHRVKPMDASPQPPPYTLGDRDFGEAVEPPE